MFEVYINNAATMDDGELLYTDLYNGTIPTIETENGVRYTRDLKDKSYQLLSPKLTLEDCAAGSFTAVVPKTNVQYNNLKPIISTITIYRYYKKNDGTWTRDWLWAGRILTVEKDWWNNKSITCEGALAYFNDTIPPLCKYSNISFLNYIKSLLTVHFRTNDFIHGSKYRPLNRIFHTGVINEFSPSGVTIPAETKFTEGSNTVLAYLVNAAKDWGLHVRVRKGTYTDGTTIIDSLLIDMLSDNGSNLHECSQAIEFGSNLMDYTDKDDWSEMCTVLHPLGKTLETAKVTGDEDHKDRLTIEGKTPSNTSKYEVLNKEYLVNKAARNTYGGIEKTIEWSDIEDATTLMQMAELYFDNYQYEAKEITVQALDLKYLGVDTDFFNLLDKIRVRSNPHGYTDESYFIVTKIDIPMEKPEDAVFTFSRSTTGNYGSDTASVSSGTLTSSSKEELTKNQIGNVLASAKENAANLLELGDSLLQGYVSLVQDEDSGGKYTTKMLITNTRDPENALQRWTWGLTGLYYQARDKATDPWSGSTIKTAINMNGEIVADRITTGTLTVSDTGNKTLFSANMSNHTVRLGQFTVQNDDLYSNSHDSYDSGISGIYIGGFTKDTVHQEGISIGIGSVGTYGIMTQYNAAGMEIYSTYNTNKRTYAGRIGSIDGSQMMLVANSELRIAAPVIKIRKDNGEGGVYYTALNGSINVNNRDIKVVNGLLIDY